MTLLEQFRVEGVEHTSVTLDGVGHLILDEAPEQVERLARPVLAR